MSYLKVIYFKIHDFYMNLSIRYKILLFFFSIIIFVSVVLGIYSYLISYNTLQDEVTSVNLRDIKQESESIDFLQKDVNDLSTFILLDPLVQAFIKTNHNYSNVSLEPLNSLLASKDYISFIIIYANNGSQYYLSSDRSTGIASYEDVKKSDIYQRAHNLGGAPLWVNLNERNQIFILDNKYPKVAMVRTILNTNTLQESGFMVICINHSTLEHIYSGNSDVNKSTTILLDDNNAKVSLIDPKNVLQKEDNISSMQQYINSPLGYNMLYFNGSKYLVTHSLVKHSNWKIVSLVPVVELLKHLDSILTMTLGVIFACLVVSFVMVILISKALTSPIEKLLISMKKVKTGNFKEKVDFKYNDEIGMLGSEYNDMVDNIRTLINSVYKLQLKEKEAELKALQAQINPHFLYNTLDTIFWKAEKSNQKEISEMVYALSRLFRITLNRGNEFILVRSEKEFIEHYLLLQSKRYRDKLNYEIDISVDILDYRIPKLIIQPFVENAIIHGTEGDNDKSNISVKGFKLNESLVFTITDDGVGMSQETIDELLGKSPVSQKGYAVGNVNQRLSLHYKSNYKLTMESEPGKGTKVNIIVALDPQLDSQ